MGLLDGQAPIDYYGGGGDSNYQFTSLDDVITQFQIAYVGEDKIISKVRRSDIAFHAQRALQELSFDTFKSTKAQEITLPPSLQMVLPQDYVNYTKISSVDSSGIKHLLYPTSKTSNPISPEQLADGSYDFSGFLTNPNFEGVNNVGKDLDPVGNWKVSHTYAPTVDSISVVNEELSFTHGSKAFGTNGIASRTYLAYQKINIGSTEVLELNAEAAAAISASNVKGGGNIRIGLTTLEPSAQAYEGQTFNWMTGHPNSASSQLQKDDIFNLKQDGNELPSFIDFSDNADTSKGIAVNVEDILPVGGVRTVYVLIISHINNFTTTSDGDGNESINTVNSVRVVSEVQGDDFILKKESKAWSSYKSATPSENQDDYQDDTYWPMNGSRYGLDPQHSQANGSFYIDNNKGKIHFSSNISGKTVILDYISDSLGTDAEMQVHKFAEEAIYKCIAYAILSTRANTQEYIVQRFKKERFAAVRTAKLRLSNIKLEELTQILRGKSKQIKH
jgi:hypothetical protein